MEKKKGFVKSLEKFFAGKGFYIVLFLCVAVIGVSTWAMLSGTGTDVENEGTGLSAYDGYVAPMGPVITPDGHDAALPPDIPDSDVEDDPVANIIPEEPDTLPDSISAPQEPDTPTMADAEGPATFVWPLAGEIEVPYAVTSLIYDKTMADWRTHDGIDLAAELGTHVMAVSAGRVERIYTDDLYGVTVVIDHGGGLRSIYSNLAETPTVYENSSVMAGEIIGSVGTSALAEAGVVTHVHLGMTLDGLSVNPALYLPPR